MALSERHGRELNPALHFCMGAAPITGACLRSGETVALYKPTLPAPQ